MEDTRVQRIRELIEPLRVAPGSEVVLERDYDPGDTRDLFSEEESKGLVAQGVELLRHYQSRLAAQDTYGVLMVLQALDAGGKDGTIRHVMSGVNPQGVVVHGFRKPSAEELDHDYLWRYVQKPPARGQIGIFNRSHYEDVLVVRVHPELLERQQLPPSARGEDVWERRYRQINDWERHLVENGLAVVKLFLNLSKEEQRYRFLRADRLPREELEVQRERRQGAGALGRVPGARSRRCSRDEHRVRAVVRDPRRPQVVHARRRGRRARERAASRSIRSSRP